MEPRRRAPRLPWLVAGATLAALLAMLLVPRWTGRADAPPPPVAAGSSAADVPAGDARAVDLSAMSPREAADRLFNRVMQNVSAGDSAEARRFLPMAMAAYGRVEPLDTDGRYHLAVLHLVDRDAPSARAQADTILAEHPRHLFGLFTAAQAEGAMGNRDGARALYRRFLDAYETERQQELPEYQDHAQALPPMREEAQRVLGEP
jgi:hypothetical protein